LIEILQEDKIFSSSTYEYSKVRLFALEANDFGLGIGKQHSLIKATSNGDSRSTFCELRLERGIYKLLVDVENKGEVFPRNYEMIVHSTSQKISIKELSQKKNKNLLMETLSNLAIQRGSVKYLNEDQSLRRYVFSSVKLGICVFTYANRSANSYSIVDKVKVEGEHSCSKNIEHGKIRISVPLNMKKFIVFRFEDPSFNVEIVDCSVQAK